MTVDAFAVALSTVFDPARSREASTRRVVARPRRRPGGRAGPRRQPSRSRRGQAEQPDARIETSVAALREVLWRGRSLAEAEADGSVVVHGLRTVVRRFLKLFPTTVPRERRTERAPIVTAVTAPPPKGSP